MTNEKKLKEQEETEDEEDKEEEKEEEEVSEEKVTKTEVKVDLSSISEYHKSVLAMTEKITKLANDMEAMKETAKAKVIEIDEPEVPKAPEDLTKGVVGAETDTEELTSGNYRLERADNGKGFAFSRDYTQEGTDTKLKHLVRV